MDEKQLQLLKDNGINVDAAISRFGGRAELLKKFILKFLDDQCYDKLVTALDENNVEDAFLAAHTLKGVASNLALDPLHAVVDNVTEILRPKTPDCIDKAKACMGDVSDMYNKMIEIIGQLAE